MKDPKYPRIPLTSLVADIGTELKLITKMSGFSDEDIYSWCVDAARQIVNSTYGGAHVYLTVSKHTAIIPKDFYMLEEIWLCDPVAMSYSSKDILPGQEPMKWIKSKLLVPGDSNTSRYCTKNCLAPGSNDVKLSYTFKIPPGIARFSFHTGKVYLGYIAMEKDENGVVLMQDEINGILAVKNYVKMMLLEEPYMLGKVSQNIYTTFSNGWKDYLSAAQMNLKFPSAADTDYLAIKQDQRFRRFRYRDQ